MAALNTFLACCFLVVTIMIQLAEPMEKVSLRANQIQQCKGSAQCRVVETSIDSCHHYNQADGMCSLQPGQHAKLVTKFERGALAPSVVQSGRIKAIVRIGGDTTFEHMESPSSYKVSCVGDICTVDHDFEIPFLPKTDIMVDYALVRRGTNDQIICFTQKIRIV